STVAHLGWTTGRRRRRSDGSVQPSDHPGKVLVGSAGTVHPLAPPKYPPQKNGHAGGAAVSGTSWISAHTTVVGTGIIAAPRRPPLTTAAAICGQVMVRYTPLPRSISGRTRT